MDINLSQNLTSGAIKSGEFPEEIVIDENDQSIEING
jgi:hypothetical protein